MKKEVGLWIDHRKAVIVIIENNEQIIREIKSNIEPHVRFSSGSGAKGPNKSKESTAEDMRDRKFGNDLGRYYEGIVSFIRDADAIWIMGPGEAKGELENRLKREGLEGNIVGIVAVNKMTDLQIAAKVRAHFLRQEGLQWQTKK